MTIWVDADAMPKAVKEVLYRAGQKRRIEVVFVANAWLTIPQSEFLRSVRVSKGADVADDYIAEHCEQGDLVISADVPLAARVVERGATVLQPHGRELTEENVSEVLSFRDFGDALRNANRDRRPPPFSNAQKGKFSNALDRWITRNG